MSIRFFNNFLAYELCKGQIISPLQANTDANPPLWGRDIKTVKTNQSGLHNVNLVYLLYRLFSRVGHSTGKSIVQQSR